MRVPVLLTFLLLLPLLRAEEPGRVNLGVTSSSGRYRAMGPQPETNLELVTWAERFSGELEEWLGHPLPWAGAEMIVFRTQPAATGIPSRVSARETPGGLAVAEVSIVGFANLDQEDLQEELARLLLTRVMGPRAKPGAVPPAWFVTGIAQLCHAGTRERDLAHVLGRWRTGREDRVAQVLAMDAFPRGRWAGKASSAAVMAWLASQPGYDQVQESLFALWRAGGRVTPGWLAGRVHDTREPSDLEKSFDLWLQSRSDDPAFAGWSTHILTRLRDALKPSPLFMKAGSGVLPGLEQIPAFAAEPWMRASAQDQIRRLSLLLPGQPPELVAAVRAYQDYLQAVLEAVPARSATPAKPLSTAVETALIRRLQKARALQNAFEERTSLRLAWLDEAEKILDPPPPPVVLPQRGERTAIQKYTDRFDEEMKGK